MSAHDHAGHRRGHALSALGQTVATACTGEVRQTAGNHDREFHMTTMATTTSTITTAAARATGVTKAYGTDDARVLALDDVSVSIEAGRFTAIMGPSGSGKSTLLHVLAGLDRPTAGSIHIGDTEITGMNDKQLTLLRRNRIGFIFQSFNLLPTLTAAENITLPLRIAGVKPDPLWIQSIVETVGLGQRMSHKPTELSGGQQQRVAAARALASKPAIVFADEPTGALDSRSSLDLLRFLQQAVREMHQTVVMVTHDPVAAGHADRVLFLADGHIVDEMRDPTSDAVLDLMKNLGA
jgi:putative ABC transport system ATP-binding protein